MAAQSPTRFVLLCHARTGSNLVLRALENHPDVDAFGELLNHDEATRAEIAGSGPFKGAFYQQGQDAGRFLEEQVFARRLFRRARACGFKMFYEYARWDPNMNTAWGFLTGTPDIRIIHLTRRNLLECIVSHKVAEKTGQWFYEREPGRQRQEANPFWLDREECHSYFDRIVTWRAWVARAMKDHPILDLEYERDVCGDFVNAMSRVYEFLGVAPRVATIELEKQQIKSPAEQLLNFAQLRAHFRYTLYEEYFENGNHG